MLAAVHRASHPEGSHVGLDPLDTDESHEAVASAIVAARDDYRARAATAEGYESLVAEGRHVMAKFIVDAVRAAVPNHLKAESDTEMKRPTSASATGGPIRADRPQLMTVTAPPGLAAAADSEAAWVAEYRASPALQDEFGPAGGEATYVAYSRGMAEHRARLTARMPGLDLDAVRKKAKANYAGDPQLRAEFGSEDAYVSYGEAVMTNRIRVAGKNLKSEFSD